MYTTNSLAQNDTQAFPKTPKEAIDQFKGTQDLLHEFAEPTAVVTPGVESFFHSPLVLYSIYSFFIIVISAVVLYWRFKNSTS